MFGRVYFPSRQFCRDIGPARVYQTLRHEAVHLSDMQRFPVLFHFTYLFVLPLGPSLRAWWEWRAYLETLRVEAEICGDISDDVLERIERCFTGADYGYMWPFPNDIRRRLARAKRRILGEMGPRI